MAKIKPFKTQRPMPPEDLGQFGAGNTIRSFAPANEVLDWAIRELIADTGSLHNPDHAHLNGADIAFLWASSGFRRQLNWVAGQAEKVMFRCGPWQKRRQEQQMEEWFGRVPEFLITLDGHYARQCTDIEFAALVDHELYHLGQDLDEFGQPKFSKDGRPKLTLRGHDVEEFVGIVRRYGVGAAAGKMTALIEAAKGKPEVSGLDIARACGTCMLRAA